MHRPPTAEAEVAAELAALRPALGPRYAAELPGARAAVLTRLWRALAHEPLPWITGRAPGRGGLALRLADGRLLEGPLPDPFATDAYVTGVRLAGTVYDDPAGLTAALGVPRGTGFAAELGHSVASLALSRAAQEPPSGEPPRGRGTTGSGSSGWSTGTRTTRTAVPGPASRWPSSSRTGPSTGPWSGWGCCPCPRPSAWCRARGRTNCATADAC